MKTFFKTLKNTVTKRPLCCCCALLMALSSCLLFAGTPVKIAILILSLLLFAVTILLKKKTEKAKALLSCLFALSIVFSLCSASTLLSYDLFDKKCKDIAAENGSVTITGYPTKTVYESEFSNCYLLKVSKLNGKRVFGVTVLACFAPSDAPQSFEILHAEGHLTLPENHDPAFDSITYYRSKGVFAQFHSDTVSFTEKKALTLSRPLAEITSFLDKHTSSSLSDADAASLVKAVLFGNKSELPKEAKRDFATLGISHLLAVSGLHLSALVALVTFLLVKLRIPLKIRCGLLLPAVLFFAALCGFSPSVTRAAIMLTVYLLSKLVDEESDGFTALLFAGGTLVLFSPYSIFDIGFLLSFFATLGILLMAKLQLKKGKKEGRIKKLFKTVANALLVSLSAQIAVLPVLCFNFGAMSLLSIPATLLFSPLITLILYLAPVTLLLSFVPILSSFPPCFLPCSRDAPF